MRAVGITFISIYILYRILFYQYFQESTLDLYLLVGILVPGLFNLITSQIGIWSIIYKRNKMENNIKKTPLKLKGTVRKIGEFFVVEREGKPSIEKKILIIDTPDQQTFYPEIRNKKINLLESKDIKAGDQVEISFLFQGSEKDEKVYNNIVVSNINKI